MYSLFLDSHLVKLFVTAIRLLAEWQSVRFTPFLSSQSLALLQISLLEGYFEEIFAMQKMQVG